MERSAELRSEAQTPPFTRRGPALLSRRKSETCFRAVAMSGG